VLPFVDGINHIKRISQLSGVEVDVVRIAIQHLLYYKCVKIIDIFQYSNIYTCTPLIKNLANDETLQKECIKYITAAPGTLVVYGFESPN
jgi:4-hydroxy-3-methylbut-2-en-1-yl diphosphate synthase IspG/GcpE